jgi:hypothetical protein
MSLVEKYPDYGTALSEPAPVRALRRRVHPATWVAAAVLVPVLCWDAWQTQQEARHRHQGTAQLVSSPAAHAGRIVD